MAKISKGVNHPIWGPNCKAEPGPSPPCAVWAWVHPPLGPDWVICSLHGVIRAGGTGWGSRCGALREVGALSCLLLLLLLLLPWSRLESPVGRGSSSALSLLLLSLPPSCHCSPGICAAPVDRGKHQALLPFCLSFFFSPTPSLSLSDTLFLFDD